MWTWPALLTPIAEGYRLALDRAQLRRGQLAAALAQPTVLAVSGSTVALDAVRFNVGSGSITANGTAGEALNLTVDINALPLSIANAIMPDLGSAGTLNGRATIGGTGSAPRVSFEARGRGINAAAISEFGIAPLSLTTNGSFANNTVTPAALSANGSGGLTMTGSGSVPLAGNGLNLTINGSAPRRSPIASLPIAAASSAALPISTLASAAPFRRPNSAAPPRSAMAAMSIPNSMPGLRPLPARPRCRANAPS
ncbi:hypothetical protein N8D56_10020 [Devosia sp. A8/3-2]|nr:hypothetical protein N8D56_10020 [Devosia sp. A8/3-2]